VLFHALSLVITLLPYIPALLSQLGLDAFHFFTFSLVPSVFRLGVTFFRSSRFRSWTASFLPAPPRLRLSGSAVSRFAFSLLRRFSLLPIAPFRSGKVGLRLFPCSLRPAPCALFFFLALVFFLSTGVQSAQVTLQWDPNPEADAAGYKVYYGTSSGSYQSYIDVGKTTSCTLSNLQDGIPYYFAATAYDTEHTESDFSSEVVYGGGGGCTFSLSPGSQPFGSSSETGTVSVTAGAGCSWTAVSNAAWILITSNSSGSGSGPVYFSVASNSSPSSRSGTLTVAGKSFTVNQQGISPTAFTITATAGTNGSISPRGAVAVPPGGAQTFTIAPSAGYAVSEVKVDGVSVGAVASYCFGNVTADHTITASFSLLPPSPNPVLALNAGGGEYTDSRGVRYAADQHFVGGASGKSAATIRGTADGALYQDERYGNFSYAIPLANGSYDLTLKFVENNHSARNQRVFDLWVEGKLAISSLDIYAATGKNAALDLTFTISVSDGVLNLDFLPSAGEAQVSAILITKASGTPKRPPGKLKRYFTTQTRTR
jgi:hypothetical protein